MRTKGGRLAQVAAVGAVAALALSACAGGSTGGESGSDEKITLKISNWGEFGFSELIDEYEAAHPNITVTQVTGDYAATHDSLQKSLVAGSGAADIAAVDEGYITQFANQADKFVNLLEMPGGADFESQYLGWKWKESMSSDGKQIGLGTDIGGLAMCYRSDLFEAAGLPTDRDEVSALWPTWEDYIEVGQEYVAKTGKSFVDNSVSVMNPVLGQQAVGYFDTSDTLTLEPGVKTAFDTALATYTAGLSAETTQYSPAWNAAFKNGKFATIACPAWMMAYIQEQAPDAAGKWDIASVPGGGGNWGGAFLTIPAQGKHVDEAWDLVKFLSQESSQLSIFKKYGNLPSQPALYEDESLTAFTSDYFSDAPVGEIFSTAAKELEPQYYGSKSGKVRVAVENVLTLVQAGKVKPEDAWAEATAAAQKAADS